MFYEIIEKIRVSLIFIKNVYILIELIKMEVILIIELEWRYVR